MAFGVRREPRKAALPDSDPEPTPAGGAGLDGPRRMALDGLARAFEEAALGRDWIAMKAHLRRVDEAVQAVWYAARVRDDEAR